MHSGHPQLHSPEHLRREWPKADIGGPEIPQRSGGSVVSSLHCINDPQAEGHMASFIERRKFVATVGGVAAWPLAARAGAAALPLVPSYAAAESYPTRPVRFVVGFAPRGGGDLATRLMAQWLSERLGQQFVVENRVGASSNLATEQVVRAPADGYTLIQLNVANAINASLYSKLNFDVLRDLAPVASFMRVPNV